MPRPTRCRLTAASLLTPIALVTLLLGFGARSVGAQTPDSSAAWSQQRQDTTSVPTGSSTTAPTATTAPATTAPDTSAPAATGTSRQLSPAETTAVGVNTAVSALVEAAPVEEVVEAAPTEEVVEEEPVEEVEAPSTTRARVTTTLSTAAGPQSSLLAPTPPTTAAGPPTTSREERIVWLVVAALCVVGLLIAALTGRYWWYTNPKRGYVRSRAVLSQKALRDHPDTDVLRTLQGAQRRAVVDTAEVAMPPPLLAQDPWSQPQEHTVTVRENG